MWGKLTTAAYIVTAVVVMYYNYLERPSLLVDAGVWLSLALTLVSATDYFFRIRRLINQP
jgi:hypothetical protein